MADLYYIDEDYYEVGYFVYTADAVSAQSMSATVVCSVLRVIAAEINCASTTSLTCSVEKLFEASSSCSVAIVLSCLAEKTVTAQSNLLCTSTMSTSTGVVYNAVIEQVSLFNVGVIATVTSAESINCSSAVSLTVSVEVNRSTSITLNSIVTQSLQGARLRNTTAAFSTSVTQSTSAVRTVRSTVTSSSQFTQTTAVTRLRTATAASSSQFTQTTTNRRVRFGLANPQAVVSQSTSARKTARSSVSLQSSSSLVCSALSVNLTAVNLTAGFTVTCAARISIKGGRSTINSAFTVSATVDESFLTLFAGSTTGTSGYVSSSGAGIVSSRTFSPYVSGESDFYLLKTPTYLNFWFRISGSMTDGQSVRLYTSNSGDNSISVTRSGSSYFLDIRYPITVDSSQNDGYTNDWARRRLRSIGRRVTLPGLPSNWTNIHGLLTPTVSQRWFYDFNDFTGHAVVVWGDFYVNGTLASSTGLSGGSVIDVSSSSSFVGPVIIVDNTGADGGTWGNANNLNTISLDQIWIKNSLHDSTFFVNNFGNDAQPGLTEVRYDHSASLNQFYQSGNQAPIPGGRLVAPSPTSSNNITAQVWLPWRSLFDGSRTVNPQWDYTGFNLFQLGYIRDGSANLSSAFTQTTNGRRVRLGRGNLAVTATVSAVGRRNIGPIRGALTSRFTTATVARKTARITRTLSVAATTVTRNTRIRRQIAYLNSVATVTPTARKLVGTSANLIARFTTSQTARKTARGRSTITALNTQVTASVKNARGTITMESRATLDCLAVKTGEVVVQSVSTATTTASFLKQPQPRQLSSALSTTVSVNVTATKIVRTPVYFNSLFTVNAVANHITVNTFPLTSAFTLTADIVGGKIAVIDATVTATLTANTLNSKTLFGVVNITAFATELVVGTRVTIDPFLTLTVPAETGTKKVTQETSLLAVDSENRVNIITPEQRTITVPTEISTWHLPVAKVVGIRRVK